MLELDLELGVFCERSGVDAVQPARVEWTLGLLEPNVLSWPDGWRAW